MTGGSEVLYSLSRDRRLVTREVHIPNAYYGHDMLLRRHAGLPDRPSLKVAIEHGPVAGGDWFWRLDLGTPMATFLCATPGRAQQYREVGGRAPVSLAIGPQILYARPSGEQPQRDRLLFFPPHSSPDVPARYDKRAVAEKLERYRRDWNQITVCIYWRDVDDYADFYESLGVDCVTAGHYADPLFLDRLRAIIERCDAVSSIEFGSHIFYSVALGRPVRLERQEVDYTREPPAGLIGSKSEEFKAAMARLWHILEGDPSDADLDWIRELIGMREFKTGAEIRSILVDAEERYQAAYRPHQRFLHVARARTPMRARRLASPLYWRLRKV